MAIDADAMSDVIEVKRPRPDAPPGDVDNYSKQFWSRTVEQLKEQGLWRDAFAPLLERYVRACELARHARVRVPDHGTARGAAGQPVEHPLIRTPRQAEHDAHRYAEALLLLPADRHKLGFGEGVGDGLLRG